VAVAAVLGSLALSACGTGASSGGLNSAPTCDHNGVLILMAESVPSAAFVPCIAEFPAGWTFGGLHVDARRSEFWLNSDRSGDRAVTVLLDRSCDTTGAVRNPVDPDEAGTERFERPTSLPPRYVGDRFYTFPGGCVTYRFRFRPGATFVGALEATSALTFFPRARGVELLRREGLRLCGAGVRCPG
jgi:hypothetical protein